MKRIVLILTAVLITTAISAQNRFDALRYSQNFYEGSARSMAMGNAFTSLGGDLGTLSINPASSAIYKYSEFLFTPSIVFNNSNSTYQSHNSSESMTKFGVSSLGYVSYFNTSKRSNKLMNLNFSVAINKLNNYNSRFYASGTTTNSSWLSDVANSAAGIQSSQLDIQNVGDTYPYYNSGASWKAILAWNSNLLDRLPDSDQDYIGATEKISGTTIVVAGPLDQKFLRERTGGVSEFVLNFGGNISNKFYFGASLDVQTVQYSDFQKYSEFAVTTSLFPSKFDNFSHTYRLNTSGAGVNAKIGMIYTPVKGLRLGASIASPTFMSLTDEWDESIKAHYSDGYNQSILSPLGQYEYIVITPMRVNLGISYVFGKYGAISADYEGVDYSSAKMKATESYDDTFNEENDLIAQDFVFANNLRLGIELRPVTSFALRAGYAFYQNPEKDFGFDTKYLSLGAGFRTKSGLFADLGVQRRLVQNEGFSLYNDIPGHLAPRGTSDYSGWKVLLSLGFRF